jgi:hypothetical protein
MRDRSAEILFAREVMATTIAAVPEGADARFAPPFRWTPLRVTAALSRDRSTAGCCCRDAIHASAVDRASDSECGPDPIDTTPAVAYPDELRAVAAHGKLAPRFPVVDRDPPNWVVGIIRSMIS